MSPTYFFLFYMNELIENKIEELHSLLMDKPNQVLTIFNDFFGKDKVDMQGFIGVGELKSWLAITPIFEYASRELLDMNMEDYNTYREKSLTNLKGKVLDLVLNKLCSEEMVDSIGQKKFSLGFILVHFPHVRITNEYDRFVDINHLYAKIRILHDGLMNGCFALNRAEYTYLHISHNYMHSHINNIPTSDFTRFQTPCTGSGPINDTISNLNKEFDSDIWRLFCLELSKYVEVESIAGVPYHRLENLSTSNIEAVENVFRVTNRLDYYGISGIKDLIRDFTLHFINQRKLKFNYANGSYSIGMSFIEYMLVISNEFIDWYNKKFNNKEVTYSFDSLKRNIVLKEVIIANNKIYYENSRRNVNLYTVYNGKRMCTFKGADVLINIVDLNEEKGNKSIILNINIALYILSKILRVINYRYGKSEQRDQEGNRISEKIRYF